MTAIAANCWVEKKRGSLKSGRSGKKVTSRKQAIAIGLSEARKKARKFRSRRVIRFTQPQPLVYPWFSEFGKALVGRQ